MPPAAKSPEEKNEVPGNKRIAVLSKLRIPIQIAGLAFGITGTVIVRLFAVESLSAQITAAATAIPFLILGQIFAHMENIPEHSRVTLVRLSLVLSLVLTLALASASSVLTINTLRHKQDLHATERLVNLSEQLGKLRSTYQTTLRSPEKAAEVNREAADLAQQMLAINDTDLSLGMKIFKYQAIAYSWAMVAGSEMISDVKFDRSQKLEAVQKVLEAGQKAESLIQEANRLTSNDEKLQQTRAWIKKDYAEARIRRLRAIGLCIRSQINHDERDRIAAKNIIGGLPPAYIDQEHPEQTYELLPCVADGHH